MSRAPQTVGSEVGDAINSLIREGDRFKDWDAPRIHTLRRQIDQLQKVDARYAFTARGQLAAICGNISGVRENYRKALQHPDQPTTKHEFWVAMANVGLYSEAREIGEWLLEPRHQFYAQAWQKAMSLGQFGAVWARLPAAKRLWPDLQKEDFSLLERVVAVMGERSLKDESITAVLALMGDIQREHRIMFAGLLVTSVKVMRPPEEPPYLYLVLPLDTDAAEIHAMNRKFTGLVVRKLGAFPDGLVMSFEKAPPAEFRAAA